MPESNVKITQPKAFAALVLAAIASLGAVIASACCFWPALVLILGITGGTGIANLAALGPYRPILLTASLVALFFAYRGIWPPQTCAPEACERSRIKTAYKVIFGIAIVMIVTALVSPYILPLLLG